MELTIHRATPADLNAVTRLALSLWPEHDRDDLAGEMLSLLEQEDAAIFLCQAGDNAVGFAQCQLRRDYVEGCESSPVGYLEGVYVAEGYRRRGVAAALLKACEDWSRQQGCQEFASDCELDNTDSLRFHLCAGFEEANRIICFTKKL